MFIKVNDNLVNLKNTSSINVIRDYKKNKFRIIFNMNYSIDIKNGLHKPKYISDYVYWDSDETTLELNLEYLKRNKYFIDNFIRQVITNGFINKNEISSVKFSQSKYRVIFNLSHPITFTDFDGNERLTSEFVYVDCTDLKEYKQYVNYIQKQLGEQ